MLNPWYVTGFCDGEATFTYSHASGVYNMYFSLRQREDNRTIVEELCAFFNYAGNIYRDKDKDAQSTTGFTQPSAYYRISRTKELLRVIEHFDKYPLQSKKKECYKVWREMVLYKRDNWRNADFNILRPLAEKLSSLNQKSRAFKVHKK
jgi:hypothetical protein